LNSLPSIKSPNEANEKLKKLIKEETNINIQTFSLDNTFWIYIPIDAHLLEIKAKNDPANPPQPPQEKRSIHHLDGNFEKQVFSFQYDISPIPIYSKEDVGFQTNYSEYYNIVFRAALTAISRAYADVEQLPDSNEYVFRIKGDVDYIGAEKDASHDRLVHSYVKTSRVQDFFILIIADVQNGLQTKTTFYFPDLRRGIFDQTFQEEYLQRTVSEQIKGNVNTIGDYQGRHLNLQEITWPEFLTKQIIQRIDFKYSRSSFPPTKPDHQEILDLIRYTLKTYAFKDFDQVHLTDLHNEQEYTYSQTEILK
jgi:hypothetical protein